MKTTGRLRLLLIGILLAANFLIYLLSWNALQHSRKQYELRAEAQAHNITSALDQNLSNSIDKIDLSLHTVADELERQLARGGIDKAAMTAFLTRQEQHLPEVEAFRICDANGVVILGKGLDKQQPASWADREYYLYHRDHDDRSLQVTKPRMGRVAKQYIIGFSQRYNHPDGRFAGVISAPIALSHFSRILGSYSIGQDSTIVLRDRDFGLIARFPELPGNPAGEIGNRQVSRELQQLYDSGQTSGTFHTDHSSDNRQRIVSFRRVDNAPMFLISGIAKQEYLDGWWSEVWQSAAVSLGFTLISTVFGLVLLKLIKREASRKQELADHEAQLSTLIGAIPDAIQFKDREGRWLVANRFCQEIHGLDNQSWRGKNNQEIGASHPRLAEMLQADSLRDQTAWKSGEALYYETQITDPDGNKRHLEVIKLPLFHENLERQAMLAISRDITHRRENEAELELYRHHLEELVHDRTTALMDTEARATHIINSSADGLFGVDCAGTLTFINPAACEMLGLKAEQVVGQPAHAVFHHSYPDGSHYPPEICHCNGAVLQARSIRIDNEVYWHADGHAIPVMYAVHPMIRNDVNVGAVISFVDMSAQHAASQAREQALQAAENLARLRSEFLANMSHEIRTPLNGVLGFAEIGARHCDDEERTRHAFNKILESGKRLLGVVNDILDFSKIEAGRLEIEQTETCIADVVHAAVDLVRDRAEAKQLDLQVELGDTLPPCCRTDPLRLGQVLLNLLGNAVKFTETGSVALSLTHDKNWLNFRIVDTGIGIGEKQLEKLFTPFQQGDASASRRFGGTGLGLAISKRIVELMGGEIRLISTQGRGTTAEFRVPLIAADPIADRDMAGTSASPVNRPLQGISVLLAEDEIINQILLTENLCEDGALVTVVGNGREAVERVIEKGAEAFDIVLMDIQMPEMDGYEASRRILELAPNLPIIAQTAHAFAEERAKCLAAGMLDHIAKPIESEALRALILKHANKARTSSSASRTQR